MLKAKVLRTTYMNSHSNHWLEPSAPDEQGNAVSSQAAPWNPNLRKDVINKGKLKARVNGTGCTS